MRKRLKQHLYRFASRKEFTGFWYSLYKLSLRGMNYGFADNPEKSGERSVIELLKSKQPLNNEYYTLVNVGANKGQYFKLFKKLVPNYKAILFEPSALCCKLLSDLSLDNVVIHNMAVGDREGTSELFFETEGSVQSSLINQGNSQSHTVAVTTLDCIIDKTLPIDLMVIDTEGYEKNVLIGAKKLIESGKVRMIQFEHGGDLSIENKTFVKDFYDLLPNYHICHIKQNGIRKMAYSPENEIFYGTNYVAVLK